MTSLGFTIIGKVQKIFWNHQSYSRNLTSILLFLCQCCSCSCWVRLGAAGRPSLWRAPLRLFETEKSFSWRLLQSSGLHSPKSDNFICPCLSRSKLSGLISLQNGKENFSPNVRLNFWLQNHFQTKIVWKTCGCSCVCGWIQLQELFPQHKTEPHLQSMYPSS